MFLEIFGLYYYILSIISMDDNLISGRKDKLRIVFLSEFEKKYFFG